MRVGPTVRILSDVAPVVESAGGACVSGAGGFAAAAAGAPFFPEAGAGFTGTRCIFLALSSVTMMSPCCSASALSSIDFSASDQVCPGALQAQDGLNSVRKWNAFGSAV
jgi:hypothetical protein